MGPTQTYIRIVTAMGRGGAWLVLALIVFWLLTHWRQIGHRLLLVFALVVWADLAITNFCLAWELYRGTTVAATWAQIFSAVFLICFAIHFVVSKDDALATLRTSEAEDRLRKDKMADQEQARILLLYNALQILQKSEDLVAEREADRD